MGGARQLVQGVVLVLVLLAGGISPTFAASQPKNSTAPHVSAQTMFAAPEQALKALIDSLRSEDRSAMTAVLGPGSERIISSGDPRADEIQLHKFLDAYGAKHQLIQVDSDHVVLDVGPNDWPLPIPIVKADGGWRFDTAAGAQEIINRRIGRNEVSAIRTSLAYVDAQQDYFDLFKQVTGQGVYAERLVSSPGNYDGLYWPPAQGIPDSPLQPLVSRAIDEGYPGEILGGKRIPYHGYRFHILTAQGPNAPGGAEDYIQNGKMTGGYALLAWPATYGNSGIMTLAVNQDGIVFQKDLGPETAKLASGITRFDPDLSWARVDVTAQ